MLLHLYMLKLTRHVFTWSGDPQVADFYERHCSTACSHDEPRKRTTMYFVPLAGGYWKTFASPLDSFWCCNWHRVESFAKLPTASISTTANPVGKSVYRLGTELAGERLDPQAGDTFS